MAGRKRKYKAGKVDPAPFAEYYKLRRQWASAYMLKDRDMDNRGGPNKKHQIGGVFDKPRWIEYLGITEREFDTLDRSLRRHWKGERAGVDLGVVDQVMTAFGRPDLFQQWYGDIPIEEPAVVGGPSGATEGLPEGPPTP